MKILKPLLLILILLAIVIQFFPTRQNADNTIPKTDLLTVHQIPSNTATLIKNACYDCHSNHTDYPWYDKVQPFAWVLEKHINDAKREINFNLFETYSPEKQKKILNKMHQVIEEKTMPLTSYKMMHSEARLSKEERQEILDWIESELMNY